VTLLLTNKDVEQALVPEEAIAATESIYREIAEGKAINRPRTMTYLPTHSKANPDFQYRCKSQEGGSAQCGVWALRVTSDMAGFSYSGGVKRRSLMPVATGNQYCGFVILFDIERIEPIAILHDGILQQSRVAALSAVGAKYLAPKKPRSLALFGSGGQARAHIEFLCGLFPFEDVKVYSPNQEHCRRFASGMSAKLGRPVKTAASPREAVEGSNFIQSATAAWDPVFDGHWVEKGMYVASIGGADASTKRREIDDETIRRADLYVVHSKEVGRLDQSPDIWEAAQNGVKKWDEIHEIQDLLVGKVPGRTRDDEITLFNNNTGAGTQFAAVGAAVVKRARAMGLGKEIPTEWFLQDVMP
jgi:ornithine cyclodeaminase/alanine dehydrogenase-like protein (mu-crystallin family)